MKEPTILLVEDNFLNRRLIKKVLSEKGYRILESKDSAEALDMLETQNIDLIILDINLGDDDMKGVVLGQMIKEKYRIPFIYLTAYETSDIIHQIVTTQPSSYLTKPFKNIDLIISVEIALQHTVYAERPQEKHANHIVLKEGDYHIRLPFTEIDFIESEGNYLLISANEKIYRHRSTIKQVMDFLPENIFIQTHRAFIINKNKIQKYSSKEIIINNISIPISKKYIDHLKPEE